MTESMSTKERISALMDGELPREECAELLRALREEPRALRDLARYQLIREVLREADRWPVRTGAPVRGAHGQRTEGTARVLRLRRVRGGAAASGSGKAGSAGTPGGAFRLTPVWIGSIAASVAVVALLVTGYPEPGPKREAGSVTGQTALPGAGAPGGRILTGLLPARGAGPFPDSGVAGSEPQRGKDPAPGAWADSSRLAERGSLPARTYSPVPTTRWLPAGRLGEAAMPGEVVSWQGRPAGQPPDLWRALPGADGQVHDPRGSGSDLIPEAGVVGSGERLVSWGRSAGQGPGRARSLHDDAPRNPSVWANPRERLRHFRDTGDAALYTCGFFADHLETRGVSEDSFISMGGRAYRAASTLCPRRGMVYDELASGFERMVVLLDEVREETVLKTPQDIVRLYDKWRRTGSPKVAARLHQAGVFPTVPRPDVVKH